jgi:hypothetical protein
VLVIEFLEFVYVELNAFLEFICVELDKFLRFVHVELNEFHKTFSYALAILYYS